MTAAILTWFSIKYRAKVPSYEDASKKDCIFKHHHLKHWDESRVSVSTVSTTKWRVGCTGGQEDLSLGVDSPSILSPRGRTDEWSCSNESRASVGNALGYREGKGSMEKTNLTAKKSTGRRSRCIASHTWYAIRHITTTNRTAASTNDTEEILIERRNLGYLVENLN